MTKFNYRRHDPKRWDAKLAELTGQQVQALAALPLEPFGAEVWTLYQVTDTSADDLRTLHEHGLIEFHTGEEHLSGPEDDRVTEYDLVDEVDAAALESGWINGQTLRVSLTRAGMFTMARTCPGALAGRLGRKECGHVLPAMLTLDATSEDKRRTGLEIVEVSHPSYIIGYANENKTTLFGEPKALGLIDTSRGRGQAGGYWLTRAGIAVARELSEQNAHTLRPAGNANSVKTVKLASVNLNALDAADRARLKLIAERQESEAERSAKH